MKKKKYKSHTCDKEGHTSEFPFGIYWWTLKNPKYQNFEKWKKFAGDIIILHMGTKNHNHMRHSSWDTEWDIFLSFWAICVPQMTIIWYMVLEISSGTGYFLPFYLPNNPENQNFEKMKKTPGNTIILHEYHKSKSYDVWFLRYGARRTEFFSFWTILPCCPPPPLNNPKNQNFEKWKKTPTDITILHKCATNDNHMIYCSWDMAPDGCNCYFSFWAIFWLFTPITAQKKKISQKWKNSCRYHHFTQLHQKLLS